MKKFQFYAKPTVVQRDQVENELNCIQIVFKSTSNGHFSIPVCDITNFLSRAITPFFSWAITPFLVIAHCWDLLTVCFVIIYFLFFTASVSFAWPLFMFITHFNSLLSVLIIIIRTIIIIYYYYCHYHFRVVPYWRCPVCCYRLQAFSRWWQ